MPSINEQLRALGINPLELEYEELDAQFDRGRLNAEGVDIHVTSSNVAAIRYARASDSLYVQFDNHREKGGPRLYLYTGANLDDVYDDLFSAASPGGVVWDRLRRPGVGFVKM